MFPKIVLKGKKNLINSNNKTGIFKSPDPGKLPGGNVYIRAATLQIIIIMILNLQVNSCLAGYDSLPVKSADTSHRVKVNAGGEVRTRYERYWNDNWGAAPKDNNGYFLHRFRIYADIQTGHHLHVYAELKSGVHSGLNIPPRPVDEDKLDFQQLSLNYSTRFSDRLSTEIKIGRQELSLGSNRLIDKREYTNALLSFDGISMLLKNAHWQVKTFAFRQSRMSFGIFDNIPDPDRSLWGVYFTRILTDNNSGGVDLYYMGQDNRRISYTFGDYISLYDQGPYAETRHTIGGRLYNSFNGFDYDLESMYQLGKYSRNGQKIGAWRIAATIGYTFDHIIGKPRLSLNADLASGDRDSTDGSLNTFHSPYPDIIDPSTSNISGFKTGIKWGLKNKLSINVLEWVFWRTSTEDGIFGFLGFPYRAPGQNRVKYIGNSPSVTVAWSIGSHIDIVGLYAAQFVGNGFLAKEPPAKDLSYAGLSITYKFSTSLK